MIAVFVENSIAVFMRDGKRECCVLWKQNALLLRLLETGKKNNLTNHSVSFLTGRRRGLI